MLQVIQNFSSGELRVETVPEPGLRPGGILIRTVCSLISAGTERTTVETAQKNLLGKAQSRPDLVRKVLAYAKKEGVASTIQLVRNKLDTAVPLGYSSSGVVVEVAEDVTDLVVGDRVACAGQGYASHAEMAFVPRNLAVKLPASVGFDEGAYTTLGAIAMQGIRQAEVSVGEIVAVIGLGLLGQLSVQILKASGCSVVGIDIHSDACQLAEKLGADFTFRPMDDFVAIVEKLSNGYGVDHVIITAATPTNEPIVLAGDILRSKGRVVIVGAVPADIPRSPFYEKEIDIRFARSYGPGRYDTLYEEKGLDYPYGYVRWTENRNMESFVRLLAQKKVDTGAVTTHRFKIEEAGKAYDLITGKTKSAEKYVGILLDYEHRAKEPRERWIQTLPGNFGEVSDDRINVGFVGAGNFAQNFLLPVLKKNKSVCLHSVATSKGVTSTHVAKKFKFQSASAHARDVIEHPDIHCVFVATRHNLHAPYVVDALHARKAVFVEKPLAITPSELQAVVQAFKTHPGRVMVGFNRRFAPTVVEAKSFFSRRIQPAVINYRVNAGFIPKEHWTQDPVEGGGRIIGEVCHFVDLISFLLNSVPIRVFADVVSSTRDDVVAKDNVHITLKYRDGSLANLSYIACGDKSFPKERLEMFAENAVAVIDDFRRVILTRNGRTKKFGGSKQKKGYVEALSSFIGCVRSGEPCPIAFEDLVNTTLVTFKILESLSKGGPVDIRLDDRQDVLDNLARAYTDVVKSTGGTST